MKNKEQQNLFGNLDELSSWHTEWNGMPEYTQNDLMPIQQIIINFESREDIKKFAKLVGQNLTYKTKSIWYPEAKKESVVNKKYINSSE